MAFSVNGLLLDTFEDAQAIASVYAEDRIIVGIERVN